MSRAVVSLCEHTHQDLPVDHTVTQADIDAGVVRNVATATGTTPGDQPVDSLPIEEGIPVDNAPRIAMEKIGAVDPGTDDGDGVADTGETVNYTLTVVNTGNVPLSGIVVTDPKVGPVTCQANSLAPGARTTCTARYTVTQQDVDAGVVLNTATATGQGPAGQPVSTDADETVPVDGTPGLSLEKAAELVDRDGDGLADVGETINYTFTVTNTGNVPLSGIVVNDSKLGPVTCEATSLAPGERTTCTASYTVNQADIDTGSVRNVATATGTAPGEKPVESPPDGNTVDVDTTGPPGPGPEPPEPEPTEPEPTEPGPGPGPPGDQGGPDAAEDQAGARPSHLAVTGFGVLGPLLLGLALLATGGLILVRYRQGRR